jgi:protein-tyrosine phosphatase
MTRGTQLRVLFVCTGNLCRSPLAQGLFAQMLKQEGLIDRVSVDSAGTHVWCAGSPPEPVAQDLARLFGADISGQWARQLETEDFFRVNYLLAMDRYNLDHLRSRCPAGQEYKIRLLSDYSADYAGQDVVDPYGCDAAVYAEALRTIEAGMTGLLAEIRGRLEAVETRG